MEIVQQEHHSFEKLFDMKESEEMWKLITWQKSQEMVRFLKAWKGGEEQTEQMQDFIVESIRMQRGVHPWTRKCVKFMKKQVAKVEKILANQQQMDDGAFHAFMEKVSCVALFKVLLLQIVTQKIITREQENRKGKIAHVLSFLDNQQSYLRRQWIISKINESN